MGLFGNIFGKGDVDKGKAPQDIRPSTSGKDKKIYPILKPGDWVGIRTGALRQTLVGEPQNPAVVIAYGYDTPTNFEFLMHGDLANRPANEIINEAYENLKQFEVTFEYSETQKGNFLSLSGKDFCSEKILLKDFMLEAHTILNTDELLVSIPRRRCMMIVDYKSPKDTLSAFLYMHNDAWKDDSYGNPPITDLLFHLKDGEILRVLPLTRLPLDKL
jgi:uncharacterized protein YtpQ (UPF0354 family)